MLHACAWLWQKVLHNDFLYVAIFFVRCRNCFKCSNAIFTVFTNAHQDAGGERDFEFASQLQCVESTLWHFVGRSAVTRKIIAQSFNHHSL